MTVEIPTLEPSTEYPRPEPVEHGLNGTSQTARARKEGTSSSSDAILSKDLSPVLAVDTSASTQGEVLAKEQQTIRKLAESWSRRARATALVVPWNTRAERQCTLDRVNDLKSQGGTYPVQLVKATHSTSLLKQCHLWYLLTDGEIMEDDIGRFTSRLIAHGLHGKACVIILFGERPKRPTQCNISVGQAVFGSIPHCAFLFQDIHDIDEPFVFQCKGCFRNLLPQRDADIILDHETSWDQIPRISYEKLSTIEVPQTQLISRNKFLLVSGEQIDLDDLYNNRLDKSVTEKLLQSDDDLKTLLLTAQNLGKGRDIGHWLSLQKLQRSTAAFADRPDIDQGASKLLTRLVVAMRSTPRNSTLEKKLRKKLRNAHVDNWTSFATSINSSHEDSDRFDIIVDDALQKLESYRRNCGSPVIMSPVSPGRRSAPARPNGGAYGGINSQENILQQLHLGDLQLVSRFPDPAVRPYRPRPFPQNSEISSLLYLKGYSLYSQYTGIEPYQGKCALCGGVDSPLALLLKGPPAQLETEGPFPAPYSRQPIIYPLAMGSFLETDILSSFICCETCAFHVCRLGYSPEDEVVTGVIPLVPLSAGVNKKLKVEEIDAALKGRFDSAILDQIFLSILYKKLDDITAENRPESEQIISALSWECQNFTRNISLPQTLSTVSDSEKSMAMAPLASSVKRTLRSNAPEMRIHLLRYPLDGFITLVKGTIAVNDDLGSMDVVGQAVFQRLLLHFAEKHQELIDEVGTDVAAKELHNILNGKVGALVLGRFRAETEALNGTYLLSPEDLEKFHRLPVFQRVESTCACVTMLFLSLMAKLPWDNRSAEEIYLLALQRVGDPICFTSPSMLREERARELYQIAITTPAH